MRLQRHLALLICSALGAPLVAAVTAAAPLDWRPLGEPGQGGQPVSISVSPHDPQRILAGGDMLGAALSLDGGDSWLPCHGFASGEMGDSTWHPTDPQVVWFGTMMGPYRSTDGGRTWSARRVGMPETDRWKYSCPIEVVLVDPADHRRLLAFGGSSRRWRPAGEWGGVWESRDAGDSWRLLTRLTGEGADPAAAREDGRNIVAAAFGADGQAVLALVAGVGVYRSGDRGASWTLHTGGLPHTEVQRLALHPEQPDVAFLTLDALAVDDGPALPGGIYRSDDGGRSWRTSHHGIPLHRDRHPSRTAGFRGLAIARTDPRLLVAGEVSWAVGAIYRSTDGGDSWHPVATHGGDGGEDGGLKSHLAGVHRSDVLLPPGCEMRQLVIDPNDASRIYGFNTETIVRSTDGGDSWHDITAERVPGSPGHWRGRGWTGWVAKRVAFNPYRAGQIVIQAMDTARLWISDDDGASWRYASREPTPWSGGTDVAFAADGTILAGTGQGGHYTGLLLSRDWGASWEVLLGADHGLPERGPDTACSGVHVHPDDSSLMWAVLGGRLYRSVDGGERWTRSGAHHDLGRIGADPTRPGRFYLGGGSGLQVWTGEALEPVAGSPAPLGGGVHVDRQGRVLACQHRQDPGGVYRYDPATGNWDRLVDERLAAVCVSDPHDPTRLVIGTSDNPFHDHAGALGAWTSGDDGATWQDASGELPLRRVTAVAFDPHRQGVIAIGTGGRGFYRATWTADD